MFNLFDDVKDLMNDTIHVDLLAMHEENKKTESFYVLLIFLSLIKQHITEVLLSLFIK